MNKNLFCIKLKKNEEFSEILCKHEQEEARDCCERENIPNV